MAAAPKTLKRLAVQTRPGVGVWLAGAVHGSRQAEDDTSAMVDTCAQFNGNVDQV